MNNLTTANIQLPDTLEDLTQFILVGKAKLQAYMLKLQTVNKLSVAQEIRDQTLQEAQEISTALIAAEQRIGELLLAIPTQSGKRTDLETSSPDGEKVKTKSEVASDLGYTRKNVDDYQQMAKHPEVIRRVIEEATASGEVVTKSQVLKEIKAEKDKAKAELQDMKEERDYYESLLENQREQTADLMDEIDQREKKISELIEEVEKPARDFEKEKKKALAALEADYKAEKSKVNEKQKEILRLRDRIAELEGATMEGLENGNLSENVYYFCMLANNFVGNAGGLVWLTERIADMPKKEMELFLKAAHALEAFSLAFVQNLERSGHGSRSNGADGRGEVPAITDQKEHRKN